MLESIRKVSELVDRIKTLNEKDQVIFARLYKDEMREITKGNYEHIEQLNEALDEWEVIG